MAMPYLFFDGRCEEALEFYRQVLGAEVQMMLRFKDSPERASCPDGTVPPPDKVMHACVKVGSGALVASDGMTYTGKPSFQGFSLSYEAKDEADAKRRFEALAKEGEVQMPLGETFFAKSFGAVADVDDHRGGKAMRQIFVNLPVKDLERSKRFFSALGFSIDANFTDEKAACLVIEKDAIYAMLLTEPFFKTFTPRAIADAKKSTEVLIAAGPCARRRTTASCTSMRSTTLTATSGSYCT